MKNGLVIIFCISASIFFIGEQKSSAIFFTNTSLIKNNHINNIELFAYNDLFLNDSVQEENVNGTDVIYDDCSNESRIFYTQYTYRCLETGLLCKSTLLLVEIDIPPPIVGLTV